MTTSASPLDRAVQWLRSEYPLISRNLSPDVLGNEPAALAAAHSAIRYALERSGGEWSGVEDALEAFAEISFDFIKRQARFMKSGHYALSSAEGLADDLYRDEGSMRGHYLDGLLLTYALWPNHSRFLDFFDQSVVKALNDGDHVVEVGVGHGLMATRVLRAADTTYTGVDLSPHAISYCTETFRSLDLSDARWQFIEGDATTTEVSVAPAAWVVCCEVLEHVDDPTALLSGLSPLLADGGRAYITTVANLEAEDHVYLFHDAAHIRSMISAAGFKVLDERALELPGSESLSPLPMNYAAVVQPV